jgi:ribonuclease HI
MMEYTIYTDGAYSQVHNEGAFAYVILDNKMNEICKRAYKITNETNNRAELKAIISAVYALPLDARGVRVVSDSMYALNTLSGKWGRRTNLDLFKAWEENVKPRNTMLEIEWCFVKGHSGDKYNELCDTLCNDVLGYNANEEYKKYIKIK